MPECTMICLDNSEWMRNGDYTRTRFEAQHEGAHTVLGHKTKNAESTVGVISLAGGSNVGVQVLCSPTPEKIKVMRAFSAAQIGGKADLSKGLRVAQLALKYKPTHYKGRVVLFVGSPIEGDKKKLLKVAKDLRKNNVSVDIISMGEWEENEAFLEEFIQAVNKGDTSNLIVVPPGTYVDDAINRSPLGGGNQFAEYGGVNPEMDPELAAAMQASLLIASQENGGDGGGGGASSTGGGYANGAASTAPTVGTSEAPIDDDEEEALLRRAMEMSMAAVQEEESTTGEDKKEEEAGENTTDNMLDPNFMKSLVESMPGVDMNNSEIQSLLKGDKDEEDEEDTQSKKKKPKKDDKN